MGTRKNKKSNKRFRKTRSKRQRGGTIEEDLVKASQIGNTDFVKILLENPKINVKAMDKHGYTALTKAIIGGHAEIVAMLLEKDNDAIDAVLGRRGLSPTMWAIIGGHAEIVEMLLKKGANVNAKDNNGNTALYWAMMKKNNKIVEILANKGADFAGFELEHGETPLVWAVNRGEVDLVKILLTTGRFDVNAKDINGNTALIIASMKGYVDIITMLLENGADVNAKDNKGHTAIDLAKSELDMAMRSARRTNLDNYNYIVRMLHEAIETRGNKKKTMEQVKNRDVNIPSSRTLAERQLSTADRASVFQFDRRPPSKLGGKRKTKKTKKHL